MDSESTAKTESAPPPVGARAINWLAASVAINALLVYFGRGRMDVTMLIVAAIVLLAGPLTLVSLVLYLRKRKSPGGSPGAKRCFLAALTIVSLLASAIIGAALSDKDLETAKQYCESLAPMLEAHKAEHGAYPKALSELAGAAPAGLLRIEPHYQSDGEGYSLWVSDPGSFKVSYKFRGEPGKWERID